MADDARVVLACCLCAAAERWRGGAHAARAGWTRSERGWCCPDCVPCADSSLVGHVRRLLGEAPAEVEPYSDHAVRCTWPSRDAGLAALRALRGHGFKGGLVGMGSTWSALVYDRGH